MLHNHDFSVCFAGSFPLAFVKSYGESGQGIRYEKRLLIKIKISMT